MKRQLREYGVPGLMLAIKLATTLRTGWDTWLVSHDPVSVVLIDVVFLALWLALAYGGDGQEMRRFRPFAVAGAIGMYAAMVYIGWEAHHSSVAIVARFAGAIALGADVWSWAAGALANWQAEQKKKREERRRERSRVPNVYQYAQRRLLGRLTRSVDKAARRLGGHMDVMIYEQVRAALPDMLEGKFEDVITVEATPLPTERQLTSTDVKLTSPDVTPVKPAPKKLTAKERRDVIERQTEENPNVTVTELADALGVSRGTIYNDLEKLGIELGQG